MASGTILAEAFGGEVDAGFGFIVVGKMFFVSDFLIGVCEGALYKSGFTCSRKGQ